MNAGKWLQANFAGYERLSRSEKTEIKDFPVLWSIFEMTATMKRAKPQTIIDAVDQIARPFRFDGPFLAALDFYRDRFYRDGETTPYFDGLSLCRIARPLVLPVLTGEATRKRQKLTALLLIINRLRNNFLHGEKAEYAFEGQLGNFRHANRTLMAAIPLWR
ncbi:hypothetical protein NKJ88_11735 [Mesorhizobium sp. M0016]|uniref:hypothetical protein n=1 Tax=Mesorhizobium sp. M0016 TaxID=2956843 RepID=UPI00333988F3